MAKVLSRDPVLAHIRTTLGELFGERLERIILFGSRARGDETADLDYDVAIFLTGTLDRSRERRRLADLRVDLIDEHNVFFDLWPFPAEAYQDRTPLMREIRRDGLDL